MPSYCIATDLLSDTFTLKDLLISMYQKQLKLFSWNVNGIRALEKKGFSTWLQACGADIVMLQETKCSSEQLSGELCQPAGYHAEWCAAEKKGYSGVATFSRMPL